MDWTPLASDGAFVGPRADARPHGDRKENPARDVHDTTYRLLARLAEHAGENQFLVVLTANAVAVTDQESLCLDNAPRGDWYGPPRPSGPVGCCSRTSTTNRPRAPRCPAHCPPRRAYWPVRHDVVDIPGDHFTVLEERSDTTAAAVRAWVAQLTTDPAGA